MPSFVYLDDDTASRNIMELLLTRKLGYTQVNTFEDSEDFLANIAGLAYTPQVIFVDIHMQPYNGFQVLDGLRKTKSYANTRIIALTASVMNEEVEMLRNAGFDGVIGKPIDATTFPDLLNRILRGEQVWRPN